LFNGSKVGAPLVPAAPGCAKSAAKSINLVASTEIPQSPASGKIARPFLSVRSCAKAPVTPNVAANNNTDFFFCFCFS